MTCRNSWIVFEKGGRLEGVIDEHDGKAEAYIESIGGEIKGHVLAHTEPGAVSWIETCLRERG
jgi:hypothetical protein